MIVRAGRSWERWQGATRTHPTYVDPTVVPPVDPPTVVPFRPVRVTLTSTTSAGMLAELRGQGLALPADAHLVLWPYPAPDTVRLNVWMDTLNAGDTAVLPEFTDGAGKAKPYLVESANGFIRDATHNFIMADIKRGMVGLGPNTVIDHAASAYTEGQQPVPFIDPFDGKTKSGVQYRTFLCQQVNGYIGNLEIRGRSFGGVAYNCLSITRAGCRVQNVLFNDAHRGFKNSPNGEAGALTTNNGHNGYANNFEVECRDALGVRNASSPWMLNNTTGFLIEDAYVHHSVAGMPTAWTCTSTPSQPIIYRRIRSEYNGSAGGGLNGSCFNFELCVGTFEVQDSVLINNYGGNTQNDGTSNNELHISGGGTSAAIVNVRNCSIDRGVRPPTRATTLKVTSDDTFTLAVQMIGWSTYQPMLGPKVYRFDANNNPLPVWVAPAPAGYTLP